MGVLLLNKILFIILCMGILNVGRHIFEVLRRLRQETPEKYVITKRDKFLLGLSVSYIITTVFTGIIL